MNNASKLNINILWGSDATMSRNDIRRIKFAATTQFSLPPNQNKGREKRKREALCPTNQQYISYRKNKQVTARSVRDC